MEYQPLDITVISAEDIKNVNTFSKMDVYAVVSLTHDPKTKRRTNVDKDCGTTPKWNHRFNFVIDQPSISHSHLQLQLFSDRTFSGDKLIGTVSVSLRDLLNNDATSTTNYHAEHVVDYQLRTTSGKPKGTIKFSYKFGEKNKKEVVDEPVTAYPAPHVGPSTYPAAAAAPGVGMGVYPPPQPYPGYGGYPPQYGGGGYPHAGSGYGYPPPPPQPMGYGYGYAQPPPKVQKPKKNRNGLGLGLGAGLLGGLLVGDMMSDVGDMGGYDGGFDGGDFDF